MPINPNIALSFQAPQISDPLNKMAQIEQIKAYRQNALAKEREAQLVERELESMNALRKLYASGQSPTFEQAYALGGQKGADVFATQAKAKEAQSRQTSAERKALMDTVNIGRTSLAATPDDPVAYGQWRQSFISQYPEMEAFFPSEEQYLPAGEYEMGTKRQLLLNADQLAKDENALSRLNAQLESQRQIAAANRASKEQIAEKDRASAEARNLAKIAAQLSESEKPLNESQGKATAYAIRMKEANQILNDLEGEKQYTPSYLRGAAESLPLVGGYMAPVAGFIAENENEQMIRQARENFITAVLRQESGAVISDQEFAREERKYFPQAGDDKKTIAQKRRAREIAINAMSVQAGPGRKAIEKFESEGAFPEKENDTGYIGISDE